LRKPIWRKISDARRESFSKHPPVVYPSKLVNQVFDKGMGLEFDPPELWVAGMGRVPWNKSQMRYEDVVSVVMTVGSTGMVPASTDSKKKQQQPADGGSGDKNDFRMRVRFQPKQILLLRQGSSEPTASTSTAHVAQIQFSNAGTKYEPYSEQSPATAMIENGDIQQQLQEQCA
jgi:hypothetical protein